MTIEEDYRLELKTTTDRTKTWQKYLAEKHKLDGDKEVFYDIQRMQFNGAGKACDEWTSGTITTRQLMRKFKVLIDYWMNTLVDFGLATQVMTARDMEVMNGKVLNLFVNQYPLQRNDVHANDRYREMAVLCFELIDIFYSKYVPTLNDNLRSTDGLDEVVHDATTENYSRTVVTNAERTRLVRDFT